MRKRSSRKKREDFNELAADVVNHAIDEEAEKEPIDQQDQQKNPAAVALGRLGGLKGGKARAKKLTKEQRSEAARKAALARWGNKNQGQP